MAEARFRAKGCNILDPNPKNAFKRFMENHLPRFCVLDGFTTNPGDLGWEPVERRVQLTVHDRTPTSRRVERARGCAGVVTNKVRIDREMLDALPECRAVFLLSTGTNVVDLDACRERGVPVCNVPAYSTDSVAELVFAYLLDWARAVPAHVEAVRKGAWSSSGDFTFLLTPQRELAGRTLGLIGFGSIAQAVARIASAVGMRVLAHTPNPATKPDLGQTFVSLEHIWEASDAVSLHCPLGPETDRLVNADRLARMKPESVLINTGRGGLVDEAALASALEAGRPARAYLDVLTSEPPEADHPLVSSGNARITPHLAWATRAARKRLIDELAANVEAWLAGVPRNVVNGI